MTAPKPPTPLELLHRSHHNTSYPIGMKEYAYRELKTFLSPLTPPLITALSDPAMRAALEVIVEGLPEVLKAGDVFVATRGSALDDSWEEAWDVYAHPAVSFAFSIHRAYLKAKEEV